MVRLISPFFLLCSQFPLQQWACRLGIIITTCLPCKKGQDGMQKGCGRENGVGWERHVTGGSAQQNVGSMEGMRGDVARSEVLTINSINCLSHICRKFPGLVVTSA
jgi:hypothetical protein